MQQLLIKESDQYNKDSITVHKEAVQNLVFSHFIYERIVKVIYNHDWLHAKLKL